MFLGLLLEDLWAVTEDLEGSGELDIVGDETGWSYHVHFQEGKLHGQAKMFKYEQLMVELWFDMGKAGEEYKIYENGDYRVYRVIPENQESLDTVWNYQFRN